MFEEGDGTIEAMTARLIGVFLALSFIYVLGVTPMVHSQVATTTSATSTSSASMPVISNVGTNNLSIYSVQIKWNTDQPSDSLVNYGVTSSPNYLTSTDRCDGSGYVTSHCVNLSSLVPGTYYAYQVASQNSAGQTAYSAPAGYSFTTLLDTTQSTTTTSGGGSTSTTTTDTTAPVVSGVVVDTITSSGAHVHWTTDDLSDSAVSYIVGSSTTNGITSTDRCDAGGLVSVHCVILSNLSAGMLYHVAVRSMNAANLAGWSQTDNLFTTQHGTSGSGSGTSGNGSTTTTTTSGTNSTSATGPAISGIMSDNITSNAARIKWTTDQPSDSLVNYGQPTSTGYLSSRDRCDGGGLVTSHCVYLSNLLPGTYYAYQVVSSNSAGLIGYSASAGSSFTTLLPTQSSTTTTATNVTTVATASTTQSSANIDTKAPVISNISAGNVTSYSARIKWNTDEPSDSLVNYGQTTSRNYASSHSRCDNGGSVTSHCVYLSGLLPATLYAYQVVSSNSAGLAAYSAPAGASFTTLPPTPSDTTTTSSQATQIQTTSTTPPPLASSPTPTPMLVDSSSQDAASVDLQNGLQTQIPAIQTQLQQETGAPVDLSPTTRPVAGAPAPAPQTSTPTPTPATAAPSPVIAARASADVYTDTDGDGVSDYDETNIYHTDPANAHTAGCVLSDGQRIALGLDPLTCSGARVPVESPTVSGATTKAIFEVSSIAVQQVIVATTTTVAATSTPAKGKAPKPITIQTTATTTQVSFAGKALPNSFVTLYIFSTPIVVTVKTDISGAWHYTLDSELPNGDHTLYVASVDASGKILAKSPAVPFIKTAEAAEYTPLTIETTPTTDPLDILRNNLFFLAVSGMALVGVVVLMLLGARSERLAQAPIMEVPQVPEDKPRT